MDLIVQQTVAGSGSNEATLTVADILDEVRKDNQELFFASGSTSVLISYVNRIHLQILRRRKWSWMRSVPQTFITELGRPDYWIGATGSQGTGQVDAGLNLSDVKEIEADSLRNISAQNSLWRSVEAPLGFGIRFRDGTYRQDQPFQFRNDRSTPYVISLYPAPNEGNSYEMVPYPPILTTAVSGALAARTYFVKVAFVDVEGNVGEASTPAARQYIAANSLITIKAPQPPISAGTSGITYTRYNVYASTTEGSETLQNVSPTSTSSDWTEAGTGLTTTGAAAPTTSDIEPLRGYLLQFRYYKVYTQLTTTGATLQIPDDFKDVVVAGVNMLAAYYRKRPDEAAFWAQQYALGLPQMTNDQNMIPGGARFIRPDPASFVGDLDGATGVRWEYNPDL